MARKGKSWLEKKKYQEELEWYKKNKITPPNRKKKLSNLALQELVRPLMPDLIKQAVNLAYNADSESIRLSAIKLLMSKVLPDLKASTLDIDANINLQRVIRLPDKMDLRNPDQQIEDGEVEDGGSE